MLYKIGSPSLCNGYNDYEGERIYFPYASRHFKLTVNVQEQRAMPRRARFVISGIAHHAIQRAHNRQVVFATDEDFQYYLGNLIELKKVKKTSALRRIRYCLMTHHVHLLLVPPAVNSLALLLTHVAGPPTRYVNGLERRTGTLWEGRYKSSAVETAIYLLACRRPLVGAPLRAGKRNVDKPDGGMPRPKRATATSDRCAVSAAPRRSMRALRPVRASGFLARPDTPGRVRDRGV